ncbi:MAG: TetR/AcrR family transcriptional regulator [Dongiaceae bacterium]
MATAERPAAPTRREEAKERRRVELIEATIESIARRGFAETTLADVADQAGLSRGIVNFYFKSKDQLFADTLQFLADEYRQAWQRALARAGAAPADRLRAMVMVNFEPRVCSRKKIAVWFAFFGEAKSRPAYLGLCGERDREYWQALVGLVAAVIAEGGYPHPVEHVARLLDTVTDGMWLSRLMDRAGAAPEIFVESVELLLATLFPRHFPRPEAR